jgi:hypothetical protein
MNWQPVNNDNDILQDGDMFRLWQSDSTWSSWARVEVSIGMTLRDFVWSHAPRLPWLSGVNPAAMVEVRRPVTGGGV